MRELEKVLHLRLESRFGDIRTLRVESSPAVIPHCQPRNSDLPVEMERITLDERIDAVYRGQRYFIYIGLSDRTNLVLYMVTETTGPEG